MQNKSKWSALECSYVYHLLMWGFTGKQVHEIGVNLLTNRTADAIAAQGSDIRKWISKKEGFIVSNYTISPAYEAIYKQASKISTPDGLLKYKPEIPGKFIKSQVKQEVEKPQPGNNAAKTNEVQLPEPGNTNGQLIMPLKQTEEKVSPTFHEPTILDVMRYAKELGASEVEYQGMKIKY